MAYNYNDIRNPDWYSRLIAQANAGSMRQVQSTGSEADDPYFAKVRSQQLSDLSNAREDAFRAEREAAVARMGMAGESMRAREAARQRIISGALALDWKPDQLLGTQSEDAAILPQDSLYGDFGAARSSGVSVPKLPELPSIPAPAAYAAPMSGGARPQGSAGTYRPYNPRQFANPLLDSRIKRLNTYYSNIARIPVY